MEMDHPIAVQIRHLGQTREMQMAVQRSQRWHQRVRLEEWEVSQTVRPSRCPQWRPPTVPLPHQLRLHRPLRPRKLQLSNQAIPRSGRVPMPRRFNLHLRQQKLPARARQLPNPRNILLRHQRSVSCTCFVLAWFEVIFHCQIFIFLAKRIEANSIVPRYFSLSCYKSFSDPTAAPTPKPSRKPTRKPSPEPTGGTLKCLGLHVVASCGDTFGIPYMFL